jgi:prephenate dehydrogenase
LAQIAVLIPDRPGVLGEILSVVGSEGINVEDFQLVHSAEGGRGVLTVVTAGEVAERARAALARAGYLPRLQDL